MSNINIYIFLFLCACMKYIRDGNVVVARLFKGEEFIESVKSLCEKENFSSGRIQAIGAVKRAVLGYFDPEKKVYVHFECQGELASCMGNIARKNGDIIVHAHAVISEKDGTSKGGHIVTAEPSATVELFIDVISGLERAKDEETGLYLLDL